MKNVFLCGIIVFVGDKIMDIFNKFKKKNQVVGQNNVQVIPTEANNCNLLEMK